MISWQSFFLIPSCTGICGNCAAIALIQCPIILQALQIEITNHNSIICTMKLKTVLKYGGNYQYPWIATFG